MYSNRPIIQNGLSYKAVNKRAKIWKAYSGFEEIIYSFSKTCAENQKHRVFCASQNSMYHPNSFLFTSGERSTQSVIKCKAQWTKQDKGTDVFGAGINSTRETSERNYKTQHQIKSAIGET